MSLYPMENQQGALEGRYEHHHQTPQKLKHQRRQDYGCIGPWLQRARHFGKGEKALAVKFQLEMKQCLDKFYIALLRVPDIVSFAANLGTLSCQMRIGVAQWLKMLDNFSFSPA